MPSCASMSLFFGDYRPFGQESANIQHRKKTVTTMYRRVFTIVKTKTHKHVRLVSGLTCRIRLKTIVFRKSNWR